MAYAKLAATGFALNWQSQAFSEERKKKAASKTKYTCANCGTNAWAKPDTTLICGMCFELDDENVPLVAFTMKAEERDQDEQQEAA